MKIQDFKTRKLNRQKISMITCYDYWSAKIVANSQIDLILVGDSSAMVMHGHKSTLQIDTETIALHVSAVQKGAPNKFIIGDMPFLSYRKSLDHNMNNVEKIMKAGAQAIKLEGRKGNLELITHIVDSGIPVMGHIGLTPQFINQFGGFKVQGREENSLKILTEEALSLQKAGCFSLVMECIPSTIASSISQQLEIPTIGIGAGVDTDGQVLVMQDMLGMNQDFKPKFLRQFIDGHQLFLKAFNEFHESVANKSFPTIEESYE